MSLALCDIDRKPIGTDIFSPYAAKLPNDDEFHDICLQIAY